MKCFIGLGSSLGERKLNLEKAAQKLSKLSEDHAIRVSPVYETPAMVPDGAPSDWLIPYLNAVAEIQYSGSAKQLLDELKRIEKELGRMPAPRWAPRIIDLDLLIYGDQQIREASLNVPHEGVLKRSFVLDPLKDLSPSLTIPSDSMPLVLRARTLSTHSPGLMAILNLTPDSFSDGNENTSPAVIEQKIKRIEELNIQAIDLGAESTRPGATSVSTEEEWLRLEPTLRFLRSTYQNRLIRPYVSIDTRRPEIAMRALELGVDCINDVSGLADPQMLSVLKNSTCDYVLMHSLSIPANPKLTFSEGVDPVEDLKTWLHQKLEMIEANGISLSRIIFDPGIGFGKTAQQSISILKRMNEFAKYPVRLLVGHSRKSFLKSLGAEDIKSRDTATLAISLEIARQGVDILRVHDFENHAIAFRSRGEVIS